MKLIVKDEKNIQDFQVGDILVLENGMNVLVTLDDDGTDYRLLNLDTLQPTQWLSSMANVKSYVRDRYDTGISRVIPAEKLNIVEI